MIARTVPPPALPDVGWRVRHSLVKWRAGRVLLVEPYGRWYRARCEWDTGEVGYADVSFLRPCPWWSRNWLAEVFALRWLRRRRERERRAAA